MVATTRNHTHAPLRSVSTWIAAAFVAAAVVLPIAATVQWLGDGHRAEAADLRAGVLVLKLALLATGGAVALGPWLGARITYHGAPVATPEGTARRDLLLLGALLGVAAVTRLVHLDTGLWLDEINSLTDYVQRPLHDLVSTYHSQNNHPLYSLLAHVAWVGGGHAEWTIRLPAAVFGVMSLWATYRFAREVTSAREAWLAVGLLTLSYHHVWFSQNARGYTALMLFGVLGTEVLHRLLTGRSTHPGRDAWAYAAIMGLAVYTHLTAVLIVVGHLPALLVSAQGATRQEMTGRRLYALGGMALAATVALLLYALVLPQLVKLVLTPTMEGVDVEWTRLDWMVRETIRSVTSGLPGGVFVVLVVLGVLGAGVVSYWRQQPMLVPLMLGPLGATLVGVLALRHNLWPRFFFFAAPFIVLVAFRGGHVVARLAGAVGDRLALGGAVIVVLLSATTVPRAWKSKQDFPAAVRAVAQERLPTDAVATFDIAAVLEEQYMHIEGARRIGTLEELEALEAAHPRTIVIYTFPVRGRAIAPAVMARLESGAYRELRRVPATVGGGEIWIVIHDKDRPSA